jgi:uncharacterized protein (DUF433 family)
LLRILIDLVRIIPENRTEARSQHRLQAGSFMLAHQNRKPRMRQLDRITMDVAVMGGKPCIRGQRVTVEMILGLLAPGRSREEILKTYPYLEAEDIDYCLAYAAWRMEERDAPLATA